MPSPGAVATAACSATPVHDPPGAQAPDEHPARQAATVFHCVMPGETCAQLCALTPLQRRSPGEQPALVVVQFPPAQPCGQVSVCAQPVPSAVQVSTPPLSAVQRREKGAQTGGAHAAVPGALLEQPVAQKVTKPHALRSGRHCSSADATVGEQRSAPASHTGERQAAVEPVAAQRMVQLCVAVQPSPFALQVSTEPPFELQRMSVPALQTTSRQRPPSHTLPVPQGWFCQLAPELSQTCESVASTPSQRALKGVQSGALQRPVSAAQRLGQIWTSAQASPAGVHRSQALPSAPGLPRVHTFGPHAAAVQPVAQVLTKSQPSPSPPHFSTSGPLQRRRPGSQPPRFAGSTQRPAAQRKPFAQSALPTHGSPRPPGAGTVFAQAITSRSGRRIELRFTEYPSRRARGAGAPSRPAARDRAGQGAIA